MASLNLKRSGLITAVIIALLLGAAGSGLAQDDACAALAEAALKQLAVSCVDVGSNRVCYGSSVVTATAGPDTRVSVSRFEKPGDRASLFDIEALRASVFDLVTKTWGIAVLNVQGNLPLTVEPPGLVFVMLGDVSLLNGVGQDVLLRALAKPLAITVGQDLEAFWNVPNEGMPGPPDFTFPANSVLQIDGITPDGQWLRTAQPPGASPFASPFAWVDAAKVWEEQTSLEAPVTAVRGLPVIAPSARGPMQTFFLQTGIETPACSAVPPSLLYVQTPDDAAADITVNGVSLRVQGAVILRLVPDGRAPSGFALRIFVPSGLTILYAGTDDQVLLPPAFAAQAPLELDRDGRLLIADAFTPIEPVDGAELDALQPVEGLPENVLNYPAFIPSVTVASGVGQPFPVYVFDRPEQALALTRVLCSAGALPELVCTILLSAAGG